MSSTNNPAAMASPTGLGSNMSSLDTTRAHGAQAAALRLRHIVWRTAEQDREYHIKAHRAFALLTQIVERAEGFLQGWLPHYYGSPRVANLRKLLFEAQVEEARQRLQQLCGEDDAFIVMGACELYIDNLIADAAYCLRPFLGQEWTASRLRAGVELWQ
jgi:hypothetical protein